MFWKWHLLCFNYIDSVGVYSGVASSGAYHTAQWDIQGNSSVTDKKTAVLKHVTCSALVILTL